MHTVLRTTVGRVSIGLVLVAGTAGALAAPALASPHAASGHPVPATVHNGANDVEIGTAVAYERASDGSIRRVR